MNDIRRRNNRISNEVRSLIIRGMNSGRTAATLGEQFNIRPNTVRKIYYNYKKTNRINKISAGHRPTKLCLEQKDMVCNWVDENCTLTLADLKTRLLRETPELRVSLSTISRCLKEFHYSMKRVSFIPERRNTPETIEARFQFAIDYNRIMIEREKIYFVDEFGIQVHSRMSYGRSQKNTRATKVKAQLRGRNYSIAAAMCVNSLYLYQIQNRPYNVEHFGEFITNLIRHLADDGIVGAHFVMDNVRFHQNQAILQLIRSHGHFPVFVPAYSPFLNPIEELFNQWKYLVKRRQPVNEDELYESLHRASEEITQENCTNYTRHMESYLGDCLNRSEIMN